LTLNDELQAIRAMSKASLDPTDWAGLAATIEQLRMLQIAEHSLAVGEVLPDFALPDTSGRVVTSDELLDRGPLVLAFFRGGWCPYCDRTLKALEAARSAIEATGAVLAGVAPVTPAELARIAAEKGLSFPLLSDTGGALSQLCGLLYAMTPAQVAYYGGRRGIDVAARSAGVGWAVPVPATYVVARDGTIAYAFADPDWARRAEPAELATAAGKVSGRDGKGGGKD
jgi:peroxiredoxin